MNKVLVTGLGAANDLGICETCNLDFSWLLDNPSTLLWADQIYVPKNGFELAMAQNEEKHEKVINMFLNIAKEHDLIETVDLSSMYQKSTGTEIYKKMLTDSQALLETFPGIV